MSVASTLDIQASRILDPRLSQNQSTRAFQTQIGGSNVTWRKERSTSASTNQVSFQLTPNSPNSVLDRTMMLVTDVNLKFTCIATTAANQRVLQAGKQACRGFGSIVESTNLSINGLTLTQETKYVKDIYSRFSEDLDNLIKFQSLTPSLATPGDNFQDYGVGSGTTLNPLGGVASSTRRALGRGYYPIQIVSNEEVETDTDKVAIIKFRLVELFTLSPLEYEGCMVPGLTNVTSLQLNFNLSSNINRFFSRAKLAGESKFELGKVDDNTPIFSNYEIHFCEITPPVFYSIPPSTALSYYDVQRQVSKVDGVVAAGGRITGVRTNTYQLNQTPSRIIVVVKEVERNDASQTDTYAHIERVNIQYNNMASILSSASTEQLFMISSRNGSTQHYTEWRGRAVNFSSAGSEIDIGASTIGTTGSVLCLDFGKDISQDPTSLPGTSINANISFEIDFENTSAVGKSYEVVIYYVYAGVLVVSPGSAFSYRSLFTRDETLSLPLLEGDDAGSDNLKGGAKHQYGLSGYVKRGRGMRAGAQAGGVHTSGRDTGLSGGQAKPKSTLADVFR